MKYRIRLDEVVVGQHAKHGPGSRSQSVNEYLPKRRVDHSAYYVDQDVCVYEREGYQEKQMAVGHVPVIDHHQKHLNESNKKRMAFTGEARARRERWVSHRSDSHKAEIIKGYFTFISGRRLIECRTRFNQSRGLQGIIQQVREKVTGSPSGCVGGAGPRGSNP